MDPLMTGAFDLEARRAIKTALARDAYHRDIVRIVQPDLAAFKWLVASPRGVFAVQEDRVCTAIHGWFFGICRHENQFYLYENCALRDRAYDFGRIVRIDWTDGKLSNPAVLVKGLHANCHQVRVIDGILCVVDTANQAIRRYTLDGDLVDIKHPFPVAHSNSRTGEYLHMNTITKVGDQIAVMRNNSKASPEKPSEIGWLDRDWNVVSIDPLDGHWCHDIVQDEKGILWHCGSKAGELISSDGQKIQISDDMFTRGLMITADRIVVGISRFGGRQVRDSLQGGLVILDRAFNQIARLEVDGPPTDIAPL